MDVLLNIRLFPESVIHIVFDHYNCEDDTLSQFKVRLTSSTKRSICSLIQVLPEASEGSEYQSNNKIMFQFS